MIKVGTAELKNSLSKYLAQVKRGVSVIVTDHGKPVARLTAINENEPDSLISKMTNLNKAGLLSYNFSRSVFNKTTPLDIGNDIASRMVSEGRD